MDDQILDTDFIEEARRARPKIISWIPLILLWIGIASCGAMGLIFEADVIYTSVLLLATSAVMYFKPKVGKIITLLMILLGVFNVLAFFPITYNLGIRVVKFFLNIEVIMLAIGLLHMWINKDDLIPYLRKLFYGSEEEQVAASTSKIDAFKRRFSGKSIEELKVIMVNEMLTPEAREAARQLIQKE